MSTVIGIIALFFFSLFILISSFDKIEWSSSAYAAISALFLIAAAIAFK